jgi:uracil-DNA glycosylase
MIDSMPHPSPAAQDGPEPLDALLRRVRACTLCADHLPLGPRPVLQAAAGARILIAGQAPGSRVHASGVPFDDPSGVRLRDWLGLSHEQFYDPGLVAILPMGFCYPGRGKSGDAPPRPECAPAWRAALLARLPHIQMTIVLGQYALAWHVPQARQGVTAAVQDWRSRWPHTVVLPHPSPRNNGWLKHNPWFEAELVPRVRTRVAQLMRELG